MLLKRKTNKERDKAAAYIPSVGATLRLLLIACVLTNIVVVILHFTGMPYTYDILTRISPETAAELASLQLPKDFLALGVNIGDTLVVLFSVWISLFIISKRPQDRGALIIALDIIMAAQLFTGSAIRNPYVIPLAAFMTGIAHALNISLLFFFPDGRSYPRQFIWIFFLISGLLIVMWWNGLVVYHASQPNADHFSISTLSLSYLLTSGVMVSGLIAQWRRYRRFATPEQRQQIKWLLFGAIVGGGLIGLYGFLDVGLPVFEKLSISPTVKLILMRSLRLSAMGIFPLALLYSILRLRLWDIDLTINRSLVYGGVMLVVVVLFAGLFTALKNLMMLLLPNYSAELNLIVPALVSGAFFFPVRRQIQYFVDRRLYGFRFGLDDLARTQQLPHLANPGTLSGHSLGGYQLLDVVGRGGMGEVYKAHNGTQYAAIKVLANLAVTDENALRRFEREAEVIKTLNHPSIVRLYGSGKDQNWYYLAMEYVEGRTLRTLLEERGKLKLAEIKPFLQDLTAALDYAHAQNFVHRDIKPANIMIRPNADNTGFNMVLMDFGTAKLRGSGQTSITDSDAVGTIDYMAPEQIQHSRTVDHHADIYALGVVLFEVLTGRLPFEGGVAQILFGHVNQPPPDPRIYTPELPAAAAEAILRALSKDPQDRYATAGKLVAGLLDY